MGMSGLPDIYTQNMKAAAPRAKDVYIYLANHECSSYNYYVSLVYRTETFSKPTTIMYHTY